MNKVKIPEKLICQKLIWSYIVWLFFQKNMKLLSVSWKIAWWIHLHTHFLEFRLHKRKLSSDMNVSSNMRKMRAMNKLILLSRSNTRYNVKNVVNMATNWEILDAQSSILRNNNPKLQVLKKIQELSIEIQIVFLESVAIVETLIIKRKFAQKIFIWNFKKKRRSISQETHLLNMSEENGSMRPNQYNNH